MLSACQLPARIIGLVGSNGDGTDHIIGLVSRNDESSGHIIGLVGRNGEAGGRATAAATCRGNTLVIAVGTTDEANLDQWRLSRRLPSGCLLRCRFPARSSDQALFSAGVSRLQSAGIRRIRDGRIQPESSGGPSATPHAAAIMVASRSET